MPTIKDVAREAGVAVSTVSHALNNSAPVKPETRQRIMEAVQHLGYSPSQAARGLAMNRTETIAFVMPKREKEARPAPGQAEGVNENLRGLADVVSDAGYRLLLVFESPDGHGREALEVARGNAAEGIIFTNPRRQNAHYEELVKMGLPFVVMGRVEEEIPVNTIDIDNILGGYQATEHLIMMGHQRIGTITAGSLDAFFAQDRVEGYRRALADYGLEYDPSLVLEGVDTIDSGRRAADRLLDIKQPPTAIFAGSDLVAIGFIQKVLERGLKIPNDLAVVGFDNIQIGAYLQPSLTTIELPLYWMGQEAAKMLFRQIAYPKMKPKQIVVPTELIIRESSGGRHSSLISESSVYPQIIGK